MKIDLFNSHNNCEGKFLGKAHPWFKIIFVTLMIVALLGNITAYYLGMIDNINFASLGALALFIIFVACCLRLLYLAVIAIISNWQTIIEYAKTIILGIIAFLWVAFFCYIMFHDCSCDTHYDVDHVHFERYHQ